MNIDDKKLVWWNELQHGGMIISPAVLLEFLEDNYKIPSAYVYNNIRDNFFKFTSRYSLTSEEETKQTPLYRWLDQLLESFLELPSGKWKKETQIPSNYLFHSIIGETIKPNRLFFRNYDDEKPALALFIDRSSRLGMGKSRKQYGKILEYLRNKKIKLGLFTNGIQIRLVYAGLDHDSWVEWNIPNWFEETEFLPQLHGFYSLLHISSFWKEGTFDTPLLDAIESSRSRQGELSAVLGEQVRQAVELLLEEVGNTARKYPEITQITGKNPDGSSITEDAERSAIFQASVRIIMRLVVIFFAESRNLLPRSEGYYHQNYGIEGLFEQLTRAKSHESADYLDQNTNAWSRILSLFRLIYSGSPLASLQVREYRGQLFESGKHDSYDPVIRALTIFEDVRFELTNGTVLKIIEKLRYGQIRVRRGRGSTFVKGPVDFSELRTEYIGMIYEGILDYELKAAHEPMVLLNVGLQPVLPFSVLESLSSAQIKALFVKMKEKEKTPVDKETEDVEDETDILEEPEADNSEPDESEEEITEDPDTVEEKQVFITDELTLRVQKWSEAAVLAMNWVKKPKKDKDNYLFNVHLKESAGKIIRRIYREGDYYISRWGGTRKGTGTFYTKPQLAVPTVMRTLEPLCYTEEKPQLDSGVSGSESGMVKERVELYKSKALYPRKPEEILNVKVCDPACGSGSFLVASINYLTEALFGSLILYAGLMDTATARRKTLPFGKIIDKPDSSQLLPCMPDDEDFESRVKAKLKRYVVENCIYGVDLNSTAVELAKLSLWVETMDKDLPFGFLDHKIKCGNSLVGAWLETFMEYPLAAWLREGGDKNHTTSVHYEEEVFDKLISNKFNKVVKPKIVELINLRSGQQRLELFDTIPDPIKLHNELLNGYNKLHNLDESLYGLEEKQRNYNDLLRSESYLRIKDRMDLWCSLWFWPDEKIDVAPDPLQFYRLTHEQKAIVSKVSFDQKFFHWEIEFPDVFNQKSSGFDALVGNPPWETLQPNSKEYFSNIDPIYRALGKQDALKKQNQIFESSSDAELSWLHYNGFYKSFGNYTKEAYSPFGYDAVQEVIEISLSRSKKKNQQIHSLWFKQRSQNKKGYVSDLPFHYQGTGKMYTYKLFLELSYHLLNEKGLLGLIVPAGIYSDEGSNQLRQLFLNKSRWEWLFNFENRKKIFDIDSRLKFNPIIIRKNGTTDEIRTSFMIQDLKEWEEADYIIVQKADKIRKFSPYNNSFLEIRNESDSKILDKIYHNSILIGAISNPKLQFKYYQGDFNMTSDSKHFIRRKVIEEMQYKPTSIGFWQNDSFDRALPLYQGVIMNQFDYNAASYSSGASNQTKWIRENFDRKIIQPQFFILSGFYNKWKKSIRGLKLIFRDIAPATNRRTMISTLINDFPSGNKTPILKCQTLDHLVLLCAVFNSFLYDYALRNKLSGSTLNFFIINETPILDFSKINNLIKQKLVTITTNLAMNSQIFANIWMLLKKSHNLTYQKDWAITLHERSRLRCISDAIITELYGLNFAELEWILKNDTRDPKGFWRVDKDKPIELRQTTLTLQAFKRLKEIGLEEFIKEDYQFPKEIQDKLGPRFYDWQLQGTPEESWKECEYHARQILGDEGFEKFISDLEKGENNVNVAEESGIEYKAGDQLKLL